MRFVLSLALCSTVFSAAPAVLAEDHPPLAPLAAPSAELPPPAPPRYRSEGMRAAGIVITSFAAASLLAGTAVVGVGIGLGSQPHSEQGSNAGSVLLFAIGPLLGVSSAVLASVGIPLWVIGAKPPRDQAVGLLPAVSVGPTGGTLRWSF